MGGNQFSVFSTTTLCTRLRSDDGEEEEANQRIG